MSLINVFVRWSLSPPTVPGTLLSPHFLLLTLTHSLISMSPTTRPTVAPSAPSASPSLTPSLSPSTTFIISTIAGTGSASYSGDNGAATSATLKYPTDIALDSLGNVYIADKNNHCIRKVTVSTGIISTIAGTGSSSYSGDNGPATSAGLNKPYNVAVDASGMSALHVLPPLYLTYICNSR